MSDKQPVETAPIALVKPLAWTGPNKPNEECRYDHCTAETSIGTYQIEWKSWKAYDSFCLYRDHEFMSADHSLEIAKAAAQADYEARIRSALATPLHGEQG